MRFSLDMIWLDSSKTITHIEKNVAPETYPNTYCDTSQTAYVIEINAGLTDAAKVKLGEHLNL